MTALQVMDMIKYDPLKGCFVMKPDTPRKPLSPFEWAKEARPSIFALDPHFRSRHKAGLLDDDNGLKYKQFGTKHLSATPLANIHAGTLEHNKGDTIFLNRKKKESND
jgi:hypothetical protein